MSSRTSESYIAAIDIDGKSHFVAYEYDYGGSCYRSVTRLGNREYEIECSGDGECTVENGQKLPRLESADIISYFSKKHTQAMCRATALANLESYDITHFVCVTVCYAGNWVASVGCATISATDETGKQFVVDGVPNEIFGKSVEDVAADILEKGIDGYAAYLDSVRRP